MATSSYDEGWWSSVVDIHVLVHDDVRLVVKNNQAFLITWHDIIQIFYESCFNYSGYFSVWESFGTSKWFLSLLLENGPQSRISSTCCRSVDASLLLILITLINKYPGSLGVPLICLQEECLQHGPQCRLQGPSQSVMKYYVILFGNQ